MIKKCKYCGSITGLFKGKNHGKIITYNLCKLCKSKMAKKQAIKNLHTPEVIEKIRQGMIKYYKNPKNRIKKSMQTKAQFKNMRENNPKQHYAWRMKKRKQALNYKSYFTSKIELKIKSFLVEEKINYIQHKPIKNIVHMYQCDFFLPDHNLIIECDGNYWHNYPDLRPIDLKRNIELKQAGYKILRLWESEIKNMCKEEFKNKLDVWRV